MAAVSFCNKGFSAVLTHLLHSSHRKLGAVAGHQLDEASLGLDYAVLLEADGSHHYEGHRYDDGQPPLAKPVSPFNAGIVPKEHTP